MPRAAGFGILGPLIFALNGETAKNYAAISLI
jgi:hypothetical protein